MVPDILSNRLDGEVRSKKRTSPVAFQLSPEPHTLSARFCVARQNAISRTTFSKRRSSKVLWEISLLFYTPSVSLSIFPVQFGLQGRYCVSQNAYCYIPFCRECRSTSCIRSIDFTTNTLRGLLNSISPAITLQHGMYHTWLWYSSYQ